MLSRELLIELSRSGIDLADKSACPVGGGSISRAIRLQSVRGPLFLKLDSAERLDMFAAEAESLQTLRCADAAAVPRVLAYGCAGRDAYVALEWIDFAAKTTEAERRLGAALALQHRRSAARFGWHRDNYIGLTPQRNRRSADWPAFYREERLRYQFELARSRGLPDDSYDRGTDIMASIDRFFDSHAPSPSLLHGDLWGGNWGATAAGVPYLYDPAVYFGDREADLAMTRLFGGFGAAFYQAYDREWPLAVGWESRVGLYDLYHLLNHFNLFGNGYLPRLTATLRSLAPR